MSIFCSFSCLVSKDSQHVILTSFWHFGVSRTDDDLGTLSTMLDYGVSIYRLTRQAASLFLSGP